MDWSSRNGSLDIATVRQLSHERTLRPAEPVETLFERIARCAVPPILDRAAPAETLQDLPRVAGSAA